MSKIQRFAEKYSLMFSSRRNFKQLPASFDGIIILLPEWSPKDFEVIRLFITKRSMNECPIILFDIDEFKYYDEVVKLFPGCPVFNQTPVVIEYKNGELRDFRCGPELKSVNLAQ